MGLGWATRATSAQKNVSSSSKVFGFTSDSYTQQSLCLTPSYDICYVSSKKETKKLFSKELNLNKLVLRT